MSRSADSVQYYRKMECVVNRVMTRLMELVLKERPSSSKEILDIVFDVTKKNIKGFTEGKGWLCGGCAAPNKLDAAVCGSCRAGKDDPIPTSDASGEGPLLISVRRELAMREEALEAREKAVSEKEKELGIVSNAPTSKVKAKAASETPSRFGDGADLMPSQEKVPEKPTLLPPSYAPPKVASSPDGKGVLQYLKTWMDAKGQPLWKDETISDFCSDADFLVQADRKKGRSGNEPAMIVRALYAYTHSQLGPRSFWAVWVPAVQDIEEGDEKEPTPGKWEPLFGSSSELEVLFQKGGFSSLTRVPATGELCNALSIPKESGPKEGIVVTAMENYEKIGLSTYSAPGGVFLVRYENNLRGHRAYSPLRDTVAYLPAGDRLKDKNSLLDDIPKQSRLPLSGVLEYVAANTPDSHVHGGAEKNKEGQKLPPVWHCRPFTDPDITKLIEECMDQPNQQKADKGLHEKAMKVLQRNKVAVQEDGFPAISAELFGAVFKKSCNYQEGVLLTPEEIGRAFTLQCLTWQGRHFLVTLSTTTAETRTPHILGEVETGEVIPVYRVVASFWPAQIFYLLNLAMRETQFGNSSAALTISSNAITLADGTLGKYLAKQPSSWVEELDAPMEAPMFLRQDKGFFGTANKVTATWAGDCWQVKFPTGKTKHVESGAWVAPKAWMLPQVRPLIFYTNKALQAVQVSQDSSSEKKTYRGISCALSREVYATGRVLVWAQYSSTSEDQGVAAAFAKGEKPAAVFTMHGRTCVAVKPFSRFAREAEMLYRQNTCFRVTESLTKEQAQILGKENLQLFTLEEVSEVEMHCILVRRMLPFAKTTAAASVVFQAEAALKGNKCLELSISSTTDGEVPAKWQAFFQEPSLGCPVNGSSAWTNPTCETALLDKLCDAYKHLQPVGANEVPHHSLFLNSAPEGRHATLGLKSIKLTAQGLTDAHGTYKHDEDCFGEFNIVNDEDFTVKYEEGMWTMEYDGNDLEDSITFKCEHLLGEWPQVNKISGPVIKPMQIKNESILQPRCDERHLLVVDKSTEEEKECYTCDKVIDGPKHLTCRKCEQYYHPRCQNYVGWDGIKFKVENSTLVKYEDDEIVCPHITKLTIIGSDLVDQRGTKVSAPSECDILPLARLCAMTFVEHNLPLAKEQSHPATEIISIARKLVGNEDIDVVRIFGKKGQNDKIKLKVGVHGENGWCIDAKLRQTDARPGLAVGDEGALMASRIVRLGVPLEVVGLRNNCVKLEGAKELLESVRENPWVIETTIGNDDGNAQDNMETEVYRQALSIRCMYHRCRNRYEQLTDDHLSGVGEMWPEIIALALHDIPNLKLPMGAILDQHPEGWKEMCKRFKSPPQVTQAVLHNACKYGRVKAVKPILDDCKVDPNIEDDQGNPPLVLAVRQHAFESEEGGKIIGRLVTPEIAKKCKSVLFSAVEACGPIVTGELLKMGIEPEDPSKLLKAAVQNKAFESGTDVLHKIIKMQEDIKTSDALLAVASVEGGGSFLIMKELIDAGVGIEQVQSYGDNYETAGMTALHLVAGYKTPLTDEDKKVVKLLISEEVLKMEEDCETPLKIAMNATPEMTLFLLDNGATIPTTDETGSYLSAACQNELFNSDAGIEALKRIPKSTENNDTREALGEACKVGHLLIADYLISIGTSVTEKSNCYDMTPLAMCCKSTFDWATTEEGRSILDKLITKDTLESKDDEQQTPLAIAIGSGLVFTADYLIDKGADVMVKNEEGWSMAAYLTKSTQFESTEKGNEVIRRIITKDNVNELIGTEDEGDEDKFSPLMMAAALGRVKLCKILLELGAKVSTSSTASALTFAVNNPAFGEDLKLFEKLITKETINQKSDNDETPLEIAIQRCNFKLIPVLLQHGATGEDIISGICTNEAYDSPEGVEVAKALITKENIDTPVDGETPLYRALSWGLLSIAAFLIEAGAVTTAPEDGESMLVEACNTQSFNSPEGRHLISKLANEKNINEEHGKPLRTAASNGYLELVEELLDKKADLSLFDPEDRRTVLMEAASESDWNTVEGCKVLKRILDAAENLQELFAVQDSNGDTCLHDAASYSMFSMLDVLLKKVDKKTLAVKNEQEKTPLHCICDTHATTQLQMRVVRKLAQLPQLEIQDKNGNTPLHIAVSESGQGPFDLLV